jgi:hypothetical protein
LGTIKAVILGMHPYISFDREIIQPTEPRISALSSAALVRPGRFHNDRDQEAASHFCGKSTGTD